MKKLGAVFSALLLTASITACGTADVNDINNRRVYDVNDTNNRGIYGGNNYNNGIYDVNDADVNDVYDADRQNGRNIYNYRMKDSPLRNDPEATDNNTIFGPDRDDTFFNDEGLNMNRTNNNR